MLASRLIRTPGFYLVILIFILYKNPSQFPTSSTQASLPPAKPIKLQLNTCSPLWLELLPGVGPHKAALIIKNRPYTSEQDLLKVPGIGPKSLSQWGAHIYLEH